MGDTGRAAEGDESPQRVWRRATSAAYVESPPGSARRVVVLDLDRPELPAYVFEESAARIWASVDGRRSEAQIATDLAVAFEAPVDVVAADVRQFVSRLRELGLVVGQSG
jgi:hypothetical protein